MVKLYLKVNVDGALVSSQSHQNLQHAWEAVQNEYKLTW